MSKYGSPDVSIDFDRADGSTVEDMTQYITTINGFDIEAIMEESHPFGVAWRESLSSGVRMVGDIVLGGFFDDTATTGPDAMFNAPASSPNTVKRTLTITWGGTKTSSVETLIQKYARRPLRNELVKFEVTLRPTGAVTEA